MNVSLSTRASRILAVATLGIASIASAQTVSLQKQNSIALGTQFAAGIGFGDAPLSIAFDGTNAYVGGFANAAGNIGVIRIDNALTANTTFTPLAGTAFTATGSRGLDSLVADSTGVYMTYDDGAGGGFVRKIDSAGNTLWNVPHANIIGGYRTGALAIDPLAKAGTPALAMVGIGSGRRVALDTASGSVIYGPSGVPGSAGLGEIVNANPTSAGAGSIGSTYRGIAFDSQGNVALSAAGGATYGLRDTQGGTNFNRITTVTGTSSATTPIAGKNVAQPAGSTTFVGQGISFVEGLGADKLLAYSSRVGTPFALSLTSTVAGVSQVTGLDSRNVQLLKTDGSQGAVNGGFLTGAEDGIGVAYTADIKTFATGKDANNNPVLFVIDFATKQLDIFGVEPTWTNDADGVWSGTGNWALGAVPDSRTTNATFAGAITAPRTVTLDGNRSVKQLKFNSASAYTINGGTNTITLGTPVNNADASLPAYITVANGSHTINAPIVLASNARFDVTNAASTLKLGKLDGSGRGLTKRGAGTLEVGHIRTSALALNEGSTVVTANGAESGISRVAALQLNGGTINLTNNGLIVDYAAADPTPYTDLLNAMLAGTINSSLVDSSKTLGIVERGSATVPSFTDAALIVDSSTVVIRFTLRGDTNLDKTVNFDDLLALAQNYGTGAGGQWGQGDTNYDGAVNFDDLLVLAQNYGSALSVSGDVLSNVGSSDFAADYALALSLVPEPTSLGLLGGLAAIGLRRRK